MESDFRVNGVRFGTVTVDGRLQRAGDPAMSMRVFLLKHRNTFKNWSMRISIYHDSVYHGVEHYVGRGQPGWRSPATTNANREPAHISRSGRYVPHVFGHAIFTLFISETVRKHLAGLPNIEFNPVVFERLVDVPMPDLGDFSWDEQERDPSAEDYETRQLNPDYEFTTLPDVAEFHQKIGPYYALLAPNLYEIKNQLQDVEEVIPDWGSYYYVTSEPEPVKLSAELLKRSPIVSSSPVHAFRDDAFARIAPFLDLDYYAIAVVEIGPPEPDLEMEAYLRQLELEERLERNESNAR